MALDGEGDLPAEARERCASETQAALTELRTALQRPLGRAPRATGTTFVAEVERLSRVHPELGVRLESGREGDVPPALEPLAQSVLAEAVRNAHKHASPTRVSVRVGQVDGAFVLEVANDGVAGRRRQAGMGLRLAAFEALQSGGVVEFGEREPGHLAGTAGRARRWLSSCAARTRLTVLVVDDHDVVHWGFRLMLTQQAWVERCVSAHSGPKAVELAIRYRPHVALVDLFIGEESGAEVCERLRAAEPRDAGAAVLRRRRDLAPGRARRRRLGLRLQGLAGAADRERGAAGRARQDGVRAPRPPGVLGLSRPRALGARADGRRARPTPRSPRRSISPSTRSRSTRARVYRKLGVRNRTEAVQRAQRLGLVS